MLFLITRTVMDITLKWKTLRGVYTPPTPCRLATILCVIKQRSCHSAGIRRKSLLSPGEPPPSLCSTRCWFYSTNHISDIRKHSASETDNWTVSVTFRLKIKRTDVSRFMEESAKVLISNGNPILPSKQKPILARFHLIFWFCLKELWCFVSWLIKKMSKCVPVVIMICGRPLNFKTTLCLKKGPNFETV